MSAQPTATNGEAPMPMFQMSNPVSGTMGCIISVSKKRQRYFRFDFESLLTIATISVLNAKNLLVFVASISKIGCLDYR